MLDIDKDKEFNLIKIFGKEKLNGYTNKRGKEIKGWYEQYPILENRDVLSWIRDKIDLFTNEGKEAQKFGLTGYLNTLQQYCIFNKVDNPSELLKEIDVDNRNLRLKNYLHFLLNYEKDKSKELELLGFRNGKKPSNATIRNNIQAKIKSFYKNRGLAITFNMKSVKSGANIKEITLTKDIIKQIQAKLESIDYRLICKFETQTGLRINDVLEELTSGKYIIEKHNAHYFIRDFETQKEKVKINFLFFTKELTDLIISNYSTELETIVKDKDNNDITIYDLAKLDLTKLFLTRNKTRINNADYLRRLKDIVKELGIEGNMKTHAFRKYFTDTLDNLENKEEKFNKHLEGREPDYRDAVYIRSLKSITRFYERWNKTEQEICIDCIIYDKTNIKIKNIEAQYKEMVKQNIEKDKHIAELTDKLESMSKDVEKFTKFSEKLWNEIKTKEMATLKSIAESNKDMFKTKKELKE